jgi:hypothetical protein
MNIGNESIQDPRSGNGTIAPLQDPRPAADQRPEM